MVVFEVLELSCSEGLNGIRKDWQLLEQLEDGPVKYEQIISSNTSGSTLIAMPGLN